MSRREPDMPASPFLFARRFDGETDGTGREAATPDRAAPTPDAPDPAVPPAPPPDPLRHTDGDLDRVRAEAHAAGRAEAAAEAAAATAESDTRRLAAALDAVARRLDAAAATADAIETAWTRAAAGIALAAVDKMLPALRHRHAAEDVARVFEAIFDGAAEPASLTVVVADDLRDAVAEHLATIVERRGFAGRLAVTGDPRMPAGDCRISWPGGGAVRDQAALWADVEAAVAALTGGEDVPAAGLEDPSEPAAEAA